MELRDLPVTALRRRPRSPWRRRAMWRTPGPSGVDLRREIPRHADIELRETELHQPGHATAEHRRDSHLRAAGGTAGPGEARRDRKQYNDGDGQTAGGAEYSPIEPAEAAPWADAYGRRQPQPHRPPVPGARRGSPPTARPRSPRRWAGTRRSVTLRRRAGRRPEGQRARAHRVARASRAGGGPPCRVRLPRPVLPRSADLPSPVDALFQRVFRRRR